ncbi:hypothetical protein ACO0LO_00380 [Undibacterium sp. TJN25]|uniref:hypothetical protein n=1 Tax=Undibacterium sp. TJN25 TaxID=3413056 RepID=UPI003BF17885
MKILPILPAARIFRTFQAPQLSACVLAGLLLAGCSSMGKKEPPASDAVGKQLGAEIAALDARYAAGSIQSMDTAEAALVQVTADEVSLQSWYAQAQQACYDVFFVNSCLAEANTHRREYRAVLQRIRIEANKYQRKLHIDELDNNLKSRQEQRP